jgi:hypothetical protein
MRKCGDCRLCCKLTPVVEARSDRSFLKVANQVCPHSKFGKGCTIYNDIDKRPQACFVWRCRWLTGEGTEDLPRPDRAGYVIDEAPDMIVLQNEETGEKKKFPAIQIWIGKVSGFKADAPLMSYMNKCADKGFGFVLRLDEKEALVCLRYNGYWQHTFKSATIEQAPEEIAKVWMEHGLA